MQTNESEENCGVQGTGVFSQVLGAFIFFTPGHISALLFFTCEESYSTINMKELNCVIFRNVSYKNEIVS